MAEQELIESFTAMPTIGIMKSEKNFSDLFRATFSVCMTVCGIKTEYDQITEKFIFDYITKHYQNYTLKEIEKAFYFNSIGKLDTRHEHYGSFDTTFVSKVMESWLVLKSQTRNRATALLPPPKPDRAATPEESYKGLIAYVKKNGEFPEFWAWSQVYLHMDECLMIEATTPEKSELYQTVMHRLKNQLELDILKIKNAHDRKERHESLTEDAQKECRKIMVKKYLKIE